MKLSLYHLKCVFMNCLPTQEHWHSGKKSFTNGKTARMIYETYIHLTGCAGTFMKDKYKLISLSSAITAAERDFVL